MSVKQLGPSTRDPLKSTDSIVKRRVPRVHLSSPKSTQPAPFSKDLTNTVGTTPASHTTESAIPNPAESVIPFPVDKSRHPSPVKPIGNRLPGAQLACPPVLTKRKYLRDALAKRDTAVIGNSLKFESKSRRELRFLCAVNFDTGRFKALSIHDLGGTSLSPTTILQCLECPDV